VHQGSNWFYLIRREGVRLFYCTLNGHVLINILNPKLYTIILFKNEAHTSQRTLRL